MSRNPTRIPPAGMTALHKLLGYTFAFPDYVQTILLAEAGTDNTLRRLDLMGDRVIGVLVADLVDRLRLSLNDVHYFTSHLESNTYLSLMYDCIWRECCSVLPHGCWPWKKHCVTRAGDKVEALFGLMYMEQGRTITPAMHGAFLNLHEKVQVHIHERPVSRWKHLRTPPYPRDANTKRQEAAE